MKQTRFGVPKVFFCVCVVVAIGFDVTMVAAATGEPCEPAWVPTFGAGPGVLGGGDATVTAMSIFNDELGGEPELYIGGRFTVAGGVFGCNSLAKWNGVRWSLVGGGVHSGSANIVKALTVWNGDLIAAGEFAMAEDEIVRNIARWDGSAWQPMGARLFRCGVSRAGIARLGW